MKMPNVNIGEIVERVVLQSGMSKSDFAKSLNLQRQNINKTVFAKKSLDTDLLCRICEVLEYDFFAYFRVCNNSDYRREAKVHFTIEAGTKKQDVGYKIVFGDNEFKITPK